jgi:preprotein translocase subunit SecD
MDQVGTRIWAKMTEKNKGKPLAIVLDNFVYSAPFVNDAITTGNSQISGSSLPKKHRIFLRSYSQVNYLHQLKLFRSRL